MDRLDDQHRPITILDIGGVSLGTDQQTAGVGHHVALSPVDRLGRILTPWPPTFGCLDRLAVDHPQPAGWLGDPPRRALAAAGEK